MTRKIYRNPFEKEVNFSNDELEFIDIVARNRQAPKDENINIVNDKRIIHRDNIETHVIGLLGEFALSKLIHSEVDTESYLSGDSIKDFELYGVSIEVKTLQGYLTFKRNADFVADVAVLVIYDSKTKDYSKVWVQGWISKHDFNECQFIDNFGYGDRPCVQPSELSSIETLKPYCIITRNFRWLMREIKNNKETTP